MNFVQVWFVGYANPVRLVEELRGKSAPQWGLYASLLRALMDSLLLYLPVFLMGRIPPTPSLLPFIPTEKYYGALIVLTPFVFLAQWLIGGAAVHVCLRLSKRPSDIDQILNIAGMATLVVGAFLGVWDWAWFFLGGMNQYLLGTSHLVIDLWWVVIFVVGLKRILGVPVWLGILLTILAFAADMPLAIMIMRSPF